MKHKSRIVFGSLPLLALLPMVAAAWNPYDTDSARQGGYGYSDDYGSPAYYGTPARPPAWNDGQAGLPGVSGPDLPGRGDWEDSDWYAVDPRRRSDAWREAPPARDPASAHYSNAPAWSKSGADADADARYGMPQPPAADAWRYGADLDGPAGVPRWQANEGDRHWRSPAAQPDWAPPGRARYRFRGDPELDAMSGYGAQGQGYRYRPLTERERQRQTDDPPYPGFHSRDLQPRGPWRSYEDEGTAFGYHPEGQPYDDYRQRR